MATEMKGVWSLTDVKKSGEVVGQTASYKINNKEVIKLTNLSTSLTVDETDGTIDGLTVDEDNKTVTLSGDALNEQTVAFTSSTYTLVLDDVPAVEFTDIQPTVASGKVTFKSPLSAGYTLSANGKTLTYTEAKTDPQEIAMVSGLATNATAENVVLDEDAGTITLGAKALKQGAASLTLKNNAAFTLAIDGDVDTITITPTEWTYSNGKGILKGTVDTAGYAVSPDGKKVNYIAATKAGTTANLVTISGLAEDCGQNAVDTEAVDENGNYVITLPATSLGTKAVSLSGNGYVFALDDGITTSENAETYDAWSVKGAKATYNQVMPAHYDVVGAKVNYTAESTVQTYATVNGLKSSGLTADGETIKDGDGEDVVTVSGKVITLTEGALNTGGVTLTSDDYSLELDDVTEPVIVEGSGVWALSGKTGGVYKAKITTGGWGLKDSQTVTYTAASPSKVAVIGTITGLKSGITVAQLTNGIIIEDGIFTILEEEGLLTDGDVTLTNGNGFSYSLGTDAPYEPEDAHSWEVDGTTAKLFFGKSAYYVASEDGNTLAYNEPVRGTSVATLQNLKDGVTTDDLPASSEIVKATAKAKNYTIPLSADALGQKTVTLSTNSTYELALDDPDGELAAESGQMIWTYTEDKTKGATQTATLSNYTTEGWALDSGKKKINYTAPIKGATLATVSGFKTGLKLNEDSTAFQSGITVYTEETDEEVTVNKVTTTRTYDAKSIAIEKAAVNGSNPIKLTSTAGYKLAVGKDLVDSEASGSWAIDKSSRAVYTYTTPAGYTVNDTGTEFNAEKSSKFTATLTGLSATTAEDVESGVVVDNDEKTITLKSSVLGTSNVTASGNYKLALASGISEPSIGNNTWDMSKKGTAVLKGQVTTAGYTQTNDTTIAYTAKTDESNKTLATINGLNTTAKQTDTTGLSVGEDNVITLSSDVLGTSKVTIKSDSYKLALDEDDEDLPLESETVTEWVTSNTTATYQTYTTGYYSMEKNKAGAETGAIIYNTPGKATVKATVTGLLKGATIDTATDYNEESKTLTLKADQLGTAKKVTLTDKDSGGYKLALASGVPTSAKNVTEWVNSGTKATYQTYDKAYYTLTDTKNISYTANGTATVHLTINGITSGSEVTASNLNTTKKTVTLNADQLNHKNNKAATKLTTSKETDYVGYTIVLANGTSQPDSDDAKWAVDGKGKANYIQPVAEGNYVLDAAGTTVTYYNADTNLTLATLSGLNKNITNDDFSGVTVSDDKVITLTDGVLQKGDNKSTKVSVSKGYTLAVESDLEPSFTDPEWDFSTLAKSGTATYNNELGAGYVVDAKTQTSVSYSAATDKNTLITLSGLNKNYSGGQTATAAGITVDDEENTVTLSNADLLTTSKITLANGKGQSYTLDVDEDLNPQDLEPSTAVWTIKGTTATLNLGTSAGYAQNEKSATTVDYVKEVANTPIATLSGLGKNAKVDGGKLGTLVNKVFTQGVFINAAGTANTYNISFDPAVLGTTDVELTNAQGSGYTYNLTADNLTEPQFDAATWNYDPSKGTATLTQTTVAGWTLNSDDNKLEYTAGQNNAVLTTFSGLSKTFEGDIDDAINTPTGTADVITVEDPTLLGTGTAKLTNAKNHTYTLALGDDVPDASEPVTEWVTSGTKASLKTYNTAYYLIDTKGAIVYKKATDVKGKLFADVSGIKKDVDINANVNERTGVITLNAAQLDTKTVTLSNKTVDSVTSEYTLALGSDATKATPATTATWVTNNTTANLTASVSAGFTASADGLKLTYTNVQPNAVLAVIKGVNKDAMNDETFTTSTTTISPATSNLSKAVTVDGKETYAFKFANDYSSAKITGAATADTITAPGDSLNINSGNGNDVINASGASVTIAAGAGDDTISVTGGGASINGGAGNDSIKSGGGNNTFYYAVNNGDDTIVSFAQATDRIMTTAKANAIAVESSNGNAVITIGAGTKNATTVTLTGKGSVVDSISIVDTGGKAITPGYAASSDVLLADDNYSMNAAAVTDITDAFHASYTPYDFEAGLDLVKKDSFTPVVSYTGDK